MPTQLDEDKTHNYWGNTYRAVRPWLERAVVARFDGLDRHILVSVQGRNDRGLVCEGDAVGRVRREEALKESSGGVKDCRTLAADLHADSDLLQVDEVRVNAADVGRRTGIKIEVPEVLAELKGLDLWIMSDGLGSPIQRSVARAERTSPSGVLAVEPGF